MTAAGVEPTQLVLVELESTPLDNLGKLSMVDLSGRYQASQGSSAKRTHIPAFS